jgi:NAD(P)H dehydrogenase (quinone)
MDAVMGLTGQVGGATARRLLASGQAVRAIVRDADKARSWENSGVELALADARDADTLRTAFTGVEGVCVMIPPNFAPEPDVPETRAIDAALRQALDAARPAKAVYLSSIGAHWTTGTGLIATLRMLEEELGALPMPSAFLRAARFMEKAQWDVPAVQATGKLVSFLQPLDRKFPMVSTADIGRIVAETLQQPWMGRRILEIEGPQRCSPLDLAHAFQALIGRPVHATAAPREQWAAIFEGQGMPPQRTTLRQDMGDGFNAGWIAFERRHTEHVQGRVPSFRSNTR